jgi:hypothetical protein
VSAVTSLFTAGNRSAILIVRPLAVRASQRGQTAAQQY